MGLFNVIYGYVQQLFGVTPEPEFPTSGLTHYYSMDEVDATTVYDSVSGCVNLTKENGSFTTGFHNNAWANNNSVFGGLVAGSASDLDFGANEPFTFSTWVKRTGATQSLLWNKEEASSPFAGYYMVVNADGSMYSRLEARGASPLQLIMITTTGTPINDSDWHHLVWRYDGSGNASGMEIIIDNSVESVTVNFDSLGSNSPSSPEKFRMGAYKSGASLNFQGLMDEFGVWNRALTDTEITTIYNSGAGRFYELSFPSSGLTSYYSMDIVNGTTVYDSIGDVTGTGTSVTFSTGKNGNAGVFNSTNSNINLGQNFNFERTDSFSISYWVKRNSTAASAPFMFSKSQASGNFAGYSAYFLATNEIDFSLVNSPTNLIQKRTSVTFTNTSDYYLITITYDGSSTAAGYKLYINGSLDSSTVVSNNLSASIQTSENFQIGNRNSALGADANIDEFGVWERELTAEEVSDLYTCGLGKFYEKELPTLPVSGATAWYGDWVNGQVTRTDLTNGTVITQWDDLSGNDWHLTQSSSSYQPTYNTTEDGLYHNTDQLKNTTFNAITGTTDRTVFAVLKHDTAIGLTHDFGYQNNTGAGRSWRPAWNASWVRVDANATFVESTGGVSLGTMYLDTLVFPEPSGSTTVTGTTHYLNGVERSQDSSGNPTTTMNTAAGIATGDAVVPPRSSGGMKGFFYEIIVYNRILSDSERVEVEEYLAIKYGLSAPVSPDKISGLTAWYGDEVNSGVTRTTLSGGTSITQWDDQSDNGWHLTGSNVTYDATDDAIYFDGSNSRLDSADNFPFQTGGTYFYTLKMNSSSASEQVTAGGTGTTLSDDSAINSQVNSGTYYIALRKDNVGGFMNAGSMSTATNRLITYTWDGASRALWWDGVSKGTDTDVNHGAFNTRIIYGERIDGINDGDFDVQEAIYYDRELTSTEIAQVEAWLNNKYSIY